MILRFRRAPHSRLSATSSGASSLNWDRQQQVKSLIDRYQVLVMTNPMLAEWLLDWVSRFFTQNGV